MNSDYTGLNFLAESLTKTRNDLIKIVDDLGGCEGLKMALEYLEKVRDYSRRTVLVERALALGREQVALSACKNAVDTVIDSRRAQQKAIDATALAIHSTQRYLTVGDMDEVELAEYNRPRPMAA